MRIDVYHHFPTEIELALGSLGDLSPLLSLFMFDQEKIMSAITDLQAAVAAEKAVVDSAVVLLGGLKAQLDAAIAAGDPAALAALSADIGAQTEALAAAVSANTPAAPAV